MTNLNTNKSPLSIFLESIANHTSGSVHITASDSDWSNIEGDRVTFHHGNTAWYGPGVQPSSPCVEPDSGSVPLIDLRHCRFMNIKGSDKTFYLQENVSPEMQRFFHNLAAIKPRAAHAFPNNYRERMSPTNDEVIPEPDVDVSDSPENSNGHPEFIVVDSTPGIEER